MKVDLTNDEINYLSKVIITIMEKDLVFTNDKFKEGKITEDLKWKLMDVSEKIYEIEAQDWMTNEKLDDCPLCKRTFMSKEIQDHVTSEMTKAKKDSNYMPKTFESKKKWTHKTILAN